MDAGSLKVVYVNHLLLYSFKMDWNIQMQFYRMDAGSLKMVYVNFHKPTFPRDFSMTIYYL